MSHHMVDASSERAFRRDVAKSKRLLEDIVGAEVAGYRAPGFSINPRTPWAHRVLAEEGFVYSSSACPARFDGSPDPHSSRKPWKAECGDGLRLLEFPPLTRRLAGQNVPVAGGSYLRLLPVRVVSHAVAAMNEAGAPAVVSLRPWEIDASQARLPETELARWRHWAGVEGFEQKLAELLTLCDFGPVGEFAGVRPQRFPVNLQHAAHAI
jgi:polysaccharide deacetylase family protein (PEP-CTERM system associated)